jgi:hypothetical protein
VVEAARALLVGIDHTAHPQPGHFIVGVLLDEQIEELPPFFFAARPNGSNR